MNVRSIQRFSAALALSLAATLVGAQEAYAHCDGLDGPVVEAGRRALESGEVEHALVWVLPEGEAEVRRAFGHALDVRGLGGEARELADHFFFETLVRVHRTGEGEPFTGLKPAGRALGPAIPASDRALETGSVTELEALLIEAVRHGLRERFEAAEAARVFDPTDVEAGRAYVSAYVPLLHYVEELHAAARGSHGGTEENGAASADPHVD
jgi:hypothetical protein